jgi:hypothetical protein
LAIFTLKRYLDIYSFKSKHNMLFNTLMMVIVYIYKRIFHLITKQ